MNDFKKNLSNILDKSVHVSKILNLIKEYNPSYIKLIQGFIIFGLTREQELSEITIERYLIDVKVFLKWYQEKDLKNFNKIEAKKYRKYLKDSYKYKGKSISIKSINTKIVAVNQFLKYLDEELGYKIAIRVKQYKIEQQNFADELITNDHIKRLLRQARKQNDSRAIAILYTLFYTGARVSEMLQLKVADVGKDYVMVRGKRNKYRELLFADKLKSQLKEYLKDRKIPIKEEAAEYLFTSREGVISRQTVHKTIKDYCGKARGIKKDIAHAHAFRHRYTKNLIDMGVTESVIAQLLGHSLTVTGIYIQQDRKELLRIINMLDIE